ncbi:MAG: glycine/sarcosine/betaine reductase selenoprotein B family protein [Longimicrobiales bacterium]|nr:glycine/sarcosine/betaine reductase selenoprotein B family protein [Longimicrobiales bacterium]
MAAPPRKDPSGESFADFRDSFSYGARTDLSFKFLKHLPEAEAAELLRALLDALGDAYDTGDVDPLVRLAYRAQVSAYTHDGARWRYEDAPFTPLGRPLAESRVLLLTTSGHFVEGDDPEPFGVSGMTQEEAVRRIGDFLREAPLLSSIPRDTDAGRLRVRHGGYDVRSVRRDPNVALPRDRLVEAEAAGRIGSLAPEILSFPGCTAQGHLKRVLPEWVERVRGADVDLALLVPV